MVVEDSKYESSRGDDGDGTLAKAKGESSRRANLTKQTSTKTERYVPTTQSTQLGKVKISPRKKMATSQKKETFINKDTSSKQETDENLEDDESFNNDFIVDNDNGDGDTILSKSPVY